LQHNHQSKFDLTCFTIMTKIINLSDPTSVTECCNNAFFTSGLFPHQSSKYLFLIVAFIPLAIWQETSKLFEDFDNIAKKNKFVILDKNNLILSKIFLHFNCNVCNSYEYSHRKHKFTKDSHLSFSKYDSCSI
jgi:ribosomal protein L33